VSHASVRSIAATHGPCSTDGCSGWALVGEPCRLCRPSVARRDALGAALPSVEADRQADRHLDSARRWRPRAPGLWGQIGGRVTVAESPERRGNGAGHGGPARGYSWPPFEPGNVAAFRHGMRASPLLREDDRAEVVELMDGIRPLLPVYRPEFEILLEQLACRIWRQRRGYADLSAHGVIREGEPASVLGHLAKVESQIVKDLDALGLTPRSMISMGLDLIRGEAARLTVTKLAALAEAEEGE
jgi:hypothetical protein